MRTRRIDLMLVVMLSISLVLANYPLVSAQTPPPIPVLYSGNVTLNGSPAPDGMNVTALDSGVVVGSSLTTGGQYAVQVCGQAGQTCNDGDTISFNLNGQLTAGQTATFQSSQRGLPQSLDLTFTGTVQQMTTSMTETMMTSSTSIPEFPAATLALLATLAVAVATLRKRSRL